MYPGDNGLLVGQTGYWADAQTSILEYDEIANRDAYTFLMRLNDNPVTVEAKEHAQESLASFEGQSQNP